VTATEATTLGPPGLAVSGGSPVWTRSDSTVATEATGPADEDYTGSRRQIRF
jgi:hypothetical protein